MKKYFLLAAIIIAIIAIISLVAIRLRETMPPQEEMVPVNILVSIPENNSEISSPFTLKGIARVFENQLNYRLKDTENSKILAEGSLYAAAPDAGQYGRFEKEISYKVDKDTPAILEVFDYSAKDGSEIDKVSISLKLTAQTPTEQPSQTTTIKLFFNNNKLDPEITCTKVFAVERTVTKTPTIGASAIEELLKGPTQAEKNQGYASHINPGVTLKSLKIVNGVATADFDAKLDEKIGGSCLVGMIRAEITQTLLQFPTVKSVVISVNEDVETALQP